MGPMGPRGPQGPPGAPQGALGVPRAPLGAPGPLIPIDPIDPIGYILYILYYGLPMDFVLCATRICIVVVDEMFSQMGATCGSIGSACTKCTKWNQ